MSKDLMLHISDISEFHVQQYAVEGGFPLSRKFYLSGFTYGNKIQDNV